MSDAAAQRPSRSPIAVVGGFLFDFGLLGTFLAMCTGFLQVLMASIVTVVGFSRRDEEGRLGTDLKELGLSVLAAVALWLFYKLVLRLRRGLLSRSLDVGIEMFVSKRYLLAREGGGLVSLISVVSVAGVAVGVMALVVVISVMNGFDRTLVDRMIGVYGHIDVSPLRGDESSTIPKDDYEELLERALATEGVIAGAPIITRQTIFQPAFGNTDLKVGGVLRGIDPAREGGVSKLQASLIDVYDRDGFTQVVDKSGRVRLAGPADFPAFKEVVLGGVLARRLGVIPGDRILLLGKVVKTATGRVPRMMELRVAGIFNTGLYDVDSGLAYASLETVQSLFALGDGVGSVHLLTEDGINLRPSVERLAQRLPSGYQLQTWQALNPAFFEALWIEKVAMFVILLLIVLVASLNIIGTLVMTVAQKTREIGILKSIGAKQGMVLRIFLLKGLFIGTVGTALGVAWGLWICRFVRNDIQRIFELPAGVYGLERLPVVVEPSTIAFIAGCSIFICLVASIIPSIRASRLNPVEALRYE